MPYNHSFIDRAIINSQLPKGVDLNTNVFFQVIGPDGKKLYEYPTKLEAEESPFFGPGCKIKESKNSWK